jgi:hypothetical protein
MVPWLGSPIALLRGNGLERNRPKQKATNLTPLEHHRFVSRDAVLAAFAHAAPIDAERFRVDVDRLADQDPAPRG